MADSRKLISKEPPLVRQTDDNACVAAALLSFLAAKDKPLANKNVAELVLDLDKAGAYDSATSMFNTRRGLEVLRRKYGLMVQMVRASLLSTIINADTFFNDFATYKYMLFGYTASNGVGHALVAYGIEVDQDGKTQLYFMNPWGDASYQTRPTEWLANQRSVFFGVLP